jgi:hypothetical protein
LIQDKNARTVAMARKHKKVTKDPFMMERFATEEVLHSTLTRLRGKYSVLYVMENTQENPNAGRIEQYKKRSVELSRLMDQMLTATIEEKKIAIKLYSKELRTLNEEKSKNRARNFPSG